MGPVEKMDGGAMPRCLLGISGWQNIFVPKRLQKTGHVVGQRCTQVQWLPRDRMAKRQFPRVQCLPADALICPAVKYVACERMPYMAHVHADLMGAPR